MLSHSLSIHDEVLLGQCCEARSRHQAATRLCASQNAKAKYTFRSDADANEASLLSQTFNSVDNNDVDVFGCFESSCSAQQYAMADKMDIDAVNGEKEEEKVGPAPNLPPERSTALWSISFQRCRTDKSSQSSPITLISYAKPSMRSMLDSPFELCDPYQLCGRTASSRRR